VAPRNKQEKLICQAFVKVLGVEKVGIDDDFFKLGGNSIKAITLTCNLQVDFHINVTDIFNFKTVRRIAKNIFLEKNNLILRLEQAKTIYQIKNRISLVSSQLQVKLDNYFFSIQRLTFDYKVKPLANILLTGATGFLGCNLLDQLLTLTDYNIFLLIRAGSDAEAFYRINRKFKLYFDKNLDQLKDSRIFVFAADLEKNNLSFSNKDFQKLASQIDSIIHAAALTKHYGEYDKFYSANVQATINLLELSKLTKMKDFHYISTSSILKEGYIPKCDQYIFTEDDLGSNLEGRSNVYVKSKYQGERVVIDYRRYGVMTNIYRVGNLAFMANNYRVQENMADNGFLNRLKCLLKLGIITPSIETEEISPVDLTAKAVVKLFNKQQLSNGIYHVFNSFSCDIAKALNEEKVLPIQTLTLAGFFDTLIKSLEKSEYKELIQCFLLHQGWLEDYTLSTNIQILQNRTTAILQQLDFEWLNIDSKIFKAFIEKNYPSLLHERV
jgi:surfactin family lipopeptide synthetase A